MHKLLDDALALATLAEHECIWCDTIYCRLCTQGRPQHKMHYCSVRQQQHTALRGASGLMMYLHLYSIQGECVHPSSIPKPHPLSMSHTHLLHSLCKLVTECQRLVLEQRISVLRLLLPPSMSMVQGS